MESPLLIPFVMGKIYCRETEHITNEQSEFLKKLLGEDVNSFSELWVEFRFEYTQLLEI